MRIAEGVDRSALLALRQERMLGRFLQNVKTLKARGPQSLALSSVSVFV